MRWIAKLERPLLVIGLLLLGIYVGARIHGYVLSQAEIERFKHQQLLVKELADGTVAVSKEPDFSLWSVKRIRGYEESLASHFSPAMALLCVPKIHLEVPVLDGTNELDLNRAVGHITGTSMPGEDGNIGIAGHRDGFFRGLKDVTTGDTIELATANETRTYVIDRIVIVDPNDVSVLARRSRPSLTLVTCYPFYFAGSAPQRYIIQATLTNSTANNLRASSHASF